MKVQLMAKQFIMRVGIVCTVVAVLWYAFPTVARADDPFLGEETWEDHVSSYHPSSSETFEAPADAVKVEVLADWRWSGKPHQDQHNETHQVILPHGDVIQCDDYGNEELEGQYIRCGSTSFDWSDDIDIEVRFSGDDSSPGSHYFRVIVQWYGLPQEIQAAACQMTTTEPEKGYTAVNLGAVDEEGNHVEIDYFRAHSNFSYDYPRTPAGNLPPSIEWPITAGEWYVQFEVSADEGATWLDGDTCRVEKETGGNIVIQEAAVCSLTTYNDEEGNTLIDLGAVDQLGNEVDIDYFKARSNFSYRYPKTPASNLPAPLSWPSSSGQWYIQFAVLPDNSNIWLDGQECRLEKEIEKSVFTAGQYQGFIGAVPFGEHTPVLEPGKEYFPSAQSVMYNVEYPTDDGRAEIVYRFNGQEVSGVTTSLFHAETFGQIDDAPNRTVITLEDGVTKLIAYRYGVEQARVFQTNSTVEPCWIHPQDQPFEHKYAFGLNLYGPPNMTGRLIYHDYQTDVQYDEDGVAGVDLIYTQPGLIALYPVAETGEIGGWESVDWMTYPTAAAEPVTYQFSEAGLYHYRISDSTGEIVAGPSSTPSLDFMADPTKTYFAQLAYPATSLFVGLYDDMKYQHPDYWLMPVDGHREHEFEFHLDYHRLPDPDLGNDHIRGDVVVDGLTLSYATTSVAQQFPYGRHDGARIGVNLLGIPDVSMVAFCQRPGYHEVVYWGGWENESYYLPEQGLIFDEDLADEWSEDRRGECIDAARRVNMELARQGLRTDHTYRHHGERSQGYQMVQQNIWSPYNLEGMYPPHVGQILKPGKLLPYFEEPEDVLFWGWDLDRGGLADGIGVYELQQHVASLGPAQYVDMTGIHPPEDVFVPPIPAVQPVAAPPAPEVIPEPVQPVPAPETPEPTPEPMPPTLPPPSEPQPTPTPPLIPTSEPEPAT